MHSEYFHFKSLLIANCQPALQHSPRWLILPASKTSIMVGIKRQRALICIKIGLFAGQKQPWEQHSEVNACRKGASIAEFQRKDEGNSPKGRKQGCLWLAHMFWKIYWLRAQTTDEEKWSEGVQTVQLAGSTLRQLFFPLQFSNCRKNFEDRKLCEFFWSWHVKADVLEGARRPACIAVPYWFKWLWASILN